MAISSVGIQAYANAQRAFSHVESALQQGQRTNKGDTFAKTLDQTLIRDTVDRSENLGAQADFIKRRTANTQAAVHPNSFTQTLSQGMQRVSALQDDKAKAIEEFAAGRTQNVHELMITLQKASLAMSLTTAVRGKVLEAYKEISRMQF